MGLKALLKKQTNGSPDEELLWGMLHIKIVRVKNLRNKDRGFSLITKDKSDPYVTVWIGDNRIYKTRTIHNDLNAQFNEEFYVPVGQVTSGVGFLVQDFDEVTKDDTLGETFLPVTELISKVGENNDGLKPDDLKRVGVHKIVYLDEKKSHGSIEYFVDFLPTRMLCKTLDVPGVYFDETKGNDPKFYMNADDDGSSPKVRYGGKNDDDKTFAPPRLWRDIYDAVCEAQHFVYVVGWSVDADQYLLRGRELTEALQNGKYDPGIGELLKAKADEGVVVNMMVWDDYTSGVVFPGQMGTHDEKTRKFLSGTKVNAQFVSTTGGDTNSLLQGTTKSVLFTHHQKFVVCDAPKKTGIGRELVAFVGGIDLTEGRWDNQKHPLFRTLESNHKDDAYNGCFCITTPSAGPREPWHDIHSMVRGPAALDVIQNFHERWMKQVPKHVSDLINFESLGFNHQTLANEGGWHCQLARSIDARVCVFDRITIQKSESKSVAEMGAGEWKAQYVQSSEAVSYKRFETATNCELHYNTKLQSKKGRIVDRSIELTNIHHIRRAKHFIYIESQYFQGSAHIWLNKTDRKVKCKNLIASEVTLKICDKIADGERFAVYILVPMWCEGITSSAQVQEIVYWEKSTIEGMYVQIQKALDDAKSDLKVTDYLNFYCLGTRETAEGSEATGTPTTPDEKLLCKTRRHPIYIHSKFMIVDDEVALIGTANVNERSMDGCRDSEIMMTYWHPDELATGNSIAKGDIHGYRMHIWASITNEMNDEFRDPKSLDCVRKMNAIAHKNQMQYLHPKVTDMDSQLLPSPFEYFESDNEVRARGELKGGLFTDTKGKVVGAKSFILPDYVTS